MRVFIQRFKPKGKEKRPMLAHAATTWTQPRRACPVGGKGPAGTPALVTG